MCRGGRGGWASGAGVADGGRGSGVLESVDGVPDIEGSEPGLSLASADEAAPRGGGEAEPAKRALGDGPDASRRGWDGVLSGEFHGRILAAHCAPRGSAGDGWSHSESGGAGGGRLTAEM